MTAAASKYTGTPPWAVRNDAGMSSGTRVATTLKRYATPTPSAMSVNMFGLRLTTDCQPRAKKGAPPHTTTGVASASWTQIPALGGDEVPRAPRQHLAHRQQEHRQGQRQTDAESPRHVHELFVLRFVRGHLQRFERHAAQRAGPGPDLAHLRVHRARVLDARG